MPAEERPELQQPPPQPQAPPPAAHRVDPLEEGALVDITPFFSGHWPGNRNDWNGDVGIRFVAEMPCVVLALGRYAEGPLAEPAMVTLWRSATQEALASVEVGGTSPVEGGYAFEQLVAPVPLEAGQEYRLSQRCKPKMPDKWYDGKASVREVAALTAARYARFVGSCCRNGVGFPNRDDGDLRRAGMLNFKVAREGLAVVSVTREELAHALVKEVATTEESAGPEVIDGHLAVLARLLALLVDDSSTRAAQGGEEDLIAKLPHGICLERHGSGDVIALLASEVRKGRALRLEVAKVANQH